VLPMILFNIIVFGGTNIVISLVSVSLCFRNSLFTMLTKLKRYPSMSKYHKLNLAMLKFDNVQVAAFFTVETILSLLYIKETQHFLSITALCRHSKTSRRILLQLIWVNIFIIALDISILGLCYAGFFILQGYFKAAVYAIKLRVEFAILNSLRSVVKSNTHHTHGSQHRHNSPTDGSGNMWGIQKPTAKMDNDLGVVCLNSDEENWIKREDIIVVERGPLSADTSTDAMRGWSANHMPLFKGR